MDQVKNAAFVWGELAPYFSCNCDKNLDDRRALWRCPVHGRREPNYDALDQADAIAAREMMIMAAEARAEGDR